MHDHCKKDKKLLPFKLDIKIKQHDIEHCVHIWAELMKIQNFIKMPDNVDVTSSRYSLICGDFNLLLNPNLDCYNHKHINNPKAKLTMLSAISECDLCDVYRHLNPDRKSFIWRRKIQRSKQDLTTL